MVKGAPKLSIKLSLSKFLIQFVEDQLQRRYRYDLEQFRLFHRIQWEVHHSRQLRQASSSRPVVNFTDILR
jgi:hypothetical protein